MNRELDNFDVFSTEETVFNAEINEKETNTTRMIVDTKKIHFMSYDEFIGSSRWIKDDLLEVVANTMTVEKETITDTQNNTNLVAVIEDKPYLVGESSYMSLEGRMCIYGNGVKELPASILADILNDRFKELDSVMVVISYNKVRSIMTTKYKILTSVHVFNTVTEILALKYGMYEMLHGQVNHRTTEAIYQLQELKEELQSTYQLQDEFEPCIYVANSDTGYSSTIVSPFFRRKGCNTGFLVEDNVSLIHMGDNEQQFRDDIEGLFHRYINVPKRLFELMNIKLKSPITALENAMSKLKIGKKLSDKVIEEFEKKISSSNVPVTAYDVCLAILDAPSVANNARTEVIQSLEKVVGKALTFNYERLQ